MPGAPRDRPPRDHRIDRSRPGRPASCRRQAADGGLAFGSLRPLQGRPFTDAVGRARCWPRRIEESGHRLPQRGRLPGGHGAGRRDHRRRGVRHRAIRSTPWPPVPWLPSASRATLAHRKARDAWLAYLRERELTEDLGWQPADKQYGGWGYSPRLPRKPARGSCPAD